MSYEITPENRVLKDGADVGYILGGVCYTDSPPKGRGVTAFRAMAGVPELQFRPLPVESVGVTTSEAETITIPIVYEDISTPAIPEPAKSPVLGDRDPNWQRWFIATHGENAFKAKWPNRQLP